MVQELAYEALAAFVGEETGYLVGEREALQLVGADGAAVFSVMLGAVEKSRVDDAVYLL